MRKTLSPETIAKMAESRAITIAANKEAALAGKTVVRGWEVFKLDPLNWTVQKVGNESSNRGTFPSRAWAFNDLVDALHDEVGTGDLKAIIAELKSIKAELMAVA